MCGRFNFSNHSKVKGTKEVGVTRSFNIAPSSEIAVLNEDMKCLKLNWGFTPTWMKQGQIINAKRETVRNKSTFKDFRKCYVPINGWYEWLKTDEGKKPYYFHSEQDTLYVKSIMRENVVVLLTTEAIDSISHIHNRMPLLSIEPVFRNWNLNQVNMDINTYEVSREVSYAGNNSLELIKPIS
jgi:putative SOS response-associated peptidase YedK